MITPVPGFRGNFNKKLSSPSSSSSSFHQKYFCSSQPKVLVKMCNYPKFHALLQTTLENCLKISTKAKHIHTQSMTQKVHSMCPTAM